MLCRQLARMALRAAPSAAARSPPAAAARLHLSARRSVASLPAAQRAVQPARLAAAQHAQPVVCKLKTRKSAAKRFKVTASGKVMRRHARKGHLLAKKSPAKKRALSGETQVARSDLNNVRDCLPYAKIR